LPAAGASDIFPDLVKALECFTRRFRFKRRGPVDGGACPEGLPGSLVLRYFSGLEY